MLFYFPWEFVTDVWCKLISLFLSLLFQPGRKWERNDGEQKRRQQRGPSRKWTKDEPLPPRPAAFISEYNVPRVPLYVCVRVRSVSVARTHLIVCRKRTLSLISSGILLRMCFRALAFSFRSWNSCSGRSIMNSAKQNTRALWRGATNSRWVTGTGAGPHARRACWRPGSMQLLKDQGPNQSPTFLSAVCLLIPISGWSCLNYHRVNLRGERGAITHAGLPTCICRNKKRVWSILSCMEARLLCTDI